MTNSEILPKETQHGEAEYSLPITHTVYQTTADGEKYVMLPDARVNWVIYKDPNNDGLGNFFPVNGELLSFDVDEVDGKRICTIRRMSGDDKKETVKQFILDAYGILYSTKESNNNMLPFADGILFGFTQNPSD
jgi:hypothetical protein